MVAPFQMAELYGLWMGVTVTNHLRVLGWSSEWWWHTDGERKSQFDLVNLISDTVIHVFYLVFCSEKRSRPQNFLKHISNQKSSKFNHMCKNPALKCFKNIPHLWKAWLMNQGVLTTRLLHRIVSMNKPWHMYYHMSSNSTSKSWLTWPLHIRDIKDFLAPQEWIPGYPSYLKFIMAGHLSMMKV